MLLLYNKNTGNIDSVLHEEYDISKAAPMDSQKVKVSFIEFGGDAFYLYINPTTEEIMLKKGLQLNPDKNQIKVGESIHFKILTENTPTSSLTFAINGNIIEINGTEFDIKFDYPGSYYIYVTSIEYYSYPITINVL